MPNIFNYNDYRKFLANYYEEKKAEKHSFSYQNFSRKAGFSSKSFIFNVMKGRKNISKSSVVNIAEAMSLSKTEAAYFEILVSFNQAANFKERNFYYEQLNNIRPQNTEASNAKKLRQDQFEFYSKWYNVVIRSLIDLFPFKDDYKRLARMVYPSITPQQAKKSVQLLERLKLIKQKKNGYYKVNDKVLATGKEVKSLAVQHYHIENMKRAENAIKTLPSDKRNISGLTLGISKDTYRQICEIILESQGKIMNIAEKDNEADGVYQLNFHLFPVTKTGSERRSK